MTKVVLNIALSLDGFIACPNEEIDWLFHDQDYGLKEFYSRIDTTLMGRKTYVLMMKMGGNPYPQIRNYVFSRDRTRKNDGENVFISENIPGFVQELKAASRKDIWVLGGGEIASVFLDLHLIDEMILSIHPIILGDGIPLFHRTDKRLDFRLTDCRTYSSGLVELYYEIVDV